MKTKIIGLIVILMFSGVQIFAEGLVSKKIKVAGNCGMCETRIEKAALSVKGVDSADWDKESKMLEVTFDSDKVDLEKIHQAIAKSGHDTEVAKAKDKVYDKLPECCKYERVSKSASPCCADKKEKGCG
jgi:periplasmic mercuric ion binding protein